MTLRCDRASPRWRSRSTCSCWAARSSPSSTPDSAHVASAEYLFFGLHGNSALVPWIWTAIAPQHDGALPILLRDRGHARRSTRRCTNVACVAMLVIGIWIEKGMGLIVPAFVPSPLGEIVEYTPTLNETLDLSSASGPRASWSTRSSCGSAIRRPDRRPPDRRRRPTASRPEPGRESRRSQANRSRQLSEPPTRPRTET
jgi:hypothetical protein